MIEEFVIGAVLIFFIALLSVAALATNLWPLWVPVAMLGWALSIHIGIT